MSNRYSIHERIHQTPEGNLNGSRFVVYDRARKDDAQPYVAWHTRAGAETYVEILDERYVPRVVETPEETVIFSGDGLDWFIDYVTK